jgi:hypothetical protein
MTVKGVGRRIFVLSWGRGRNPTCKKAEIKVWRKTIGVTADVQKTGVGRDVRKWTSKQIDRCELLMKSIQCLSQLTNWEFVNEL